MASPKQVKKVKPQPSETQSKATPSNTPTTKNNNISLVLWVLLAISATALIFSIFKNISYPLLWADESMTVVGGQRVLEFGYPKVHDGKNVFYDLRHSNPKLGIDEKTDAFIGGSNWGHYYFAAIGVKLAEITQDIYTKTGIIRSFFALLGTLGIILLGLSASKYFESKSTKIIIFTALFSLSAFSVGLGLHIREVRYYPLVILLLGALFYLFSEYALRGKLSIFWYIPLMIIALFSLFITFSPAFFIFYLATALVAGIKLALDLNAKVPIKKLLTEIGIVAAPFLVALLLAYPLLGYFKTFEINAELATFNGYSDKMYWDNFSNIWKYFSSHSIIYIAIILKLILVALYSRLLKNKLAISQLLFSAYITVFFISFIFLISRVPNYLFTRYFVAADPLIFIVVITDSLIVTDLLFGGKDSQKRITISAVLILTVLFQISKNSNLLGKRYYELTHKYEGSLDAVIPYIQSNYKDTKSLVIATNYEETSYMYYLGSKVIVGFVGNNLEEDRKILPDIIQYRKSWGTDPAVFSSYLQQAKYERKSFPIRDNFTNNSPEVIFPNPLLNHQFKTLQGQSEQEVVELYVKK
jgi:hypothetical protein